MIDFDPISAQAAREAVDKGVYGTPEHRRIEERLRGFPMTSDTPNTVTGADVGGDTKREPWFLSNDNDAEEWRITDGVENFPLEIASQTELGLAIKGTIERAGSAVLAERDEALVRVRNLLGEQVAGIHFMQQRDQLKQRIDKAREVLGGMILQDAQDGGSLDYAPAIADDILAGRTALTATETSEQPEVGPLYGDKPWLPTETSEP